MVEGLCQRDREAGGEAGRLGKERKDSRKRVGRGGTGRTLTRRGVPDVGTGAGSNTGGVYSSRAVRAPSTVGVSSGRGNDGPFSRSLSHLSLPPSRTGPAHGVKGERTVFPWVHSSRTIVATVEHTNHRR